MTLVSNEPQPGKMKSRILNLLKSVPALRKLRRALVLGKFELKDIYDSYFSRGISPRATPYGFSLVGSNSIHHRAMQQGTFEREETALFSEIFGESDVFVDVGANVGFFSCLARSKGLHVVAVEPLEKNLSYLYRNLAANHWHDVEVFPVGLSATPGIATLYGASSTGASLIATWAGASRVFQRTIALSTMDILLADRFEGKRLFVKIDVEGAEYSVLSGARKVLAASPSPVWVIEICLHEYHPQGFNPDFQRIFELFWEHGYEARTADARSAIVSSEDVRRWVQSGRADSGTINYRFSVPPALREHRGVPE